MNADRAFLLLMMVYLMQWLVRKVFCVWCDIRLQGKRWTLESCMNGTTWPEMSETAKINFPSMFLFSTTPISHSQFDIRHLRSFQALLFILSLVINLNLDLPRPVTSVAQLVILDALGSSRSGNYLCHADLPTVSRSDRRSYCYSLGRYSRPRKY